MLFSKDSEIYVCYKYYEEECNSGCCADFSLVYVNQPQIKVLNSHVFRRQSDCIPTTYLLSSWFYLVSLDIVWQDHFFHIA
jgi:hypothetical protein